MTGISLGMVGTAKNTGKTTTPFNVVTNFFASRTLARVLGTRQPACFRRKPACPIAKRIIAIPLRHGDEFRAFPAAMCFALRRRRYRSHGSANL